MGKLTFANLKKTLYYLQRNGLRNTWNAARERLAMTEKYEPTAFTGEELEIMRREAAEWIRDEEKLGQTMPFFQILVPAYRTDPGFLKDMIYSVQAQVYPKWELLILDATEDKAVQEACEEICSEIEENEGLKAAVRYVKLPSNEGISENTNAGIRYLSGDYVGLLDHDDVLTPDALLEMAMAICGRKEAGNATAESAPLVIYSDEDKWDGEEHYYEPNLKEDFNLDLLLSNNYVCHFLVMERELFRKLRLRKEYDGAQDYDLVLRATAEIMAQGLEPEKAIRHVPKVLYHWRCHGGSTAENPQSKLYAYEAGRRALQDFADEQGWNAAAKDLKHVGFYRLEFHEEKEMPKSLAAGEGRSSGDVWKGHPAMENRADLGAVGGKVLDERGQTLAGGRMAENGSVFYEGVREGFSGLLHRAGLTQDAEAVDLRCICVAKEFWSLFESVVGVPYRTRKVFEQEKSGDEDVSATQVEIFDVGTLPEGADVKALSLAFCKELRERGKRILWDPELAVRTGDKKNHQVP